MYYDPKQDEEENRLLNLFGLVVLAISILFAIVKILE